MCGFLLLLESQRSSDNYKTNEISEIKFDFERLQITARRCRAIFVVIFKYKFVVGRRWQVRWHQTNIDKLS